MEGVRASYRNGDIQAGIVAWFNGHHDTVDLCVYNEQHLVFSRESVNVAPFRFTIELGVSIKHDSEWISSILFYVRPVLDLCGWYLGPIRCFAQRRMFLC